MLESDGTEVDDDEVLQEFSPQVLLLLSVAQIWIAPTPVMPDAIEPQINPDDAAEPTERQGTFQFINKTLNLSSNIIRILLLYNRKNIIQVYLQMQTMHIMAI